LNLKSIPLVSVVIPTYNHADFIGKALRSVLNQTYQNWEAIVIDNQSIDKTYEILKKYKDRRIKYFKINNNGIIAKSRNFGIQTAKGEWVAFLDSDDCWTSDKLSICFEHFKKKVDLIYHDMEIITSKQKLFQRKINRTRRLKKPILIDLLTNGNPITNSSVIVKKKILEKVGLIDECKDLVASEDYNTWLKISYLTDRFIHIPKKLGYYFVHELGVSQKNMAPSYRRATYEFLPLLNSEQKIKLESNIRYSSGRFNYLNSNYKKAKNDLFYVAIYGDFKLKIKSILMLVLIMIHFN
jgi:glycosyltransferase involved in cell wall biosynthesis